MLRIIAIATLLTLSMAASADNDTQPLQQLPAYVLQIPASIESVLIAETDTSTLNRYTAKKYGLNDPERRYMSIGQNGVGKQHSGDRRTPLGIYFVTEQLDTSRMHEKYGPIAFPLDYPNVWDSMQSKTGDGIWIHGVLPNGGRRPPLDTDGCIALPNPELVTLQQHVQMMTTPVIITRKILMRSVKDLAIDRDKLNEALSIWAESFREGDWHRYQSMYSKDFRYRGLDREKWLTYRVQAGDQQPLLGFSLDEVALLADPEEPGLYLSRFRQTITDADGEVVTTKRLYWRRSAAGDFKIVAEDNG